MKKWLMVCTLAFIAAAMITAPASATFFTTSSMISNADCEGYSVDVQIYSGEDLGLKLMWEVKLFDASNNLITSASGSSAVPYTQGQALQSFDLDGTWGVELCGTYYATAYVKIVDSDGNIWTNYWNGSINYLILPNPALQEYTFTSDTFDCICDTGACTRTQGYWKNHPESWPVASITVGGITYTVNQAIAVMNISGSGDKTYDMFRQLVAAKLNQANGTDVSCISTAIVDADSWLAANPVGSNVRAKSAAWKNSGGALHTSLDDYNNGLLACASHCDDSCQNTPLQKTHTFKWTCCSGGNSGNNGNNGNHGNGNCGNNGNNGNGNGCGVNKSLKTKNFPNPFNPTTTLEFTVPEDGVVRVDVYNMLGEKVETLVDRSFRAGTYHVDWNASRYASGTYFFRVSMANQSVVSRVQFVK